MARRNLIWITRIAPAIGMTVLGGCATSVAPGTSDPKTFGPEIHAKADAVAVVSQPPSGAVNLGRVKAIACQRFEWEPSPTEETAMILLKAEVAKKNGDALYNPRFSYQNISLSENCRGTMHATGEALRINSTAD